MPNFDRIKKYEQDFNEGKAIAIIWCTDDVKHRALESKIKLTEQECIDVLSVIKNNHDCNYGLTWETIDTVVDDIVKER